IPRPTLIDPHLPPAIDEVIAHAMAKNPNDRYPSAGALAAATAAALTGPNTALTPGGSDTKNWTTPPLPYPTTPLPQHTPQGPPIPAYPSPAHHRASGPPPTSAGALRPRGRRKRGAIAAAVSLATALAVAAVAAILITGHKGGALAPYQPQSLTGKYGTIKLTQRPTTVAALGPGDPDAVLSLGLQPVAIGGFTGTPPNWLNDMLHSTPKRLTTLDLDALAATKPDLIIDTGDIDKPAYTKLAAIAPTLTQPADTTQQWVWQTQLRWIATALGRSDTAKMLLEHAATQQTTIKAEHPAFSGKTLTVISLTDTTTAAWAAPSPPTNYLEALGFTYNNSFKRGLNDPPEITISPGSFTWTEAQLADVMVLLRSDKAAGSGGFAGLPAQFNTYTGTLIIVDDPATITALTTGGPAATTYLNTTLATKIANQIH
ncbi:ABC transporter substrate-binding protein, partial [Mycobacterium marinum]